MGTVAAAAYPQRSGSSASSKRHHHHHHHHHDESTKYAAVSSVNAETAPEAPTADQSFRSPYTPYVVLALLTCLYAGILTQILAQYFGVLGLTVNATPKDKDSAQAAIQDTNYGNFMVDTWAIGRGLSTYATIAWASAVACAAVAKVLFRTPRYPKLL